MYCLSMTWFACSFKPDIPCPNWLKGQLGLYLTSYWWQSLTFSLWRLRQPAAWSFHLLMSVWNSSFLWTSLTFQDLHGLKTGIEISVRFWQNLEILGGIHSFSVVSSHDCPVCKQCVTPSACSLSCTREWRESQQGVWCVHCTQNYDLAHHWNVRLIDINHVLK